METVEKIAYKGREIEIYYDHDYDYTDWINEDDTFIVYDHREFYVKKEGFNPNNIFESYSKGKKIYDGHWFFPLYAYIHSGVSLSLRRGTDVWDTSFKGFVLVKREKGWSYTRKRAIKIAESTIDEWNHCLSGEIYRFSTENDSCGGFIGPEGLKDAIADAKASIDLEIKKEQKEYFKRLKTWIKNRVPFYVRQPNPFNFC